MRRLILLLAPLALMTTDITASSPVGIRRVGASRSYCSFVVSHSL